MGRRLKIVNTLASLVALLTLCGCGLYAIHKADANNNYHGIPFYATKGVCIHKVVRLEPYFVLTFTHTQNGKAVGADQATLSRKDFANHSSELTHLRTDILGGEGDIGEDWAKLSSLHYDPHLEEAKVDPENWYIVADKVEPSVYVDYSQALTLNVRRPIIGSAQATTKVAPDGTLTEATAQAEDKTLSTLFDMVPAKELIKSAAGVAALKGETEPTEGVELSIEEKGVAYTRTYVLAGNTISPCSAASDDDRAETDKANKLKPHDTLVEDIGSDKKPGDASSNIKVSGTIELPKAKSDDKPK